MSKKSTPDDYLQAARVPHTLKEQSFGTWEILRIPFSSIYDPKNFCPESFRQVPFENIAGMGWKDCTFLRRMDSGYFMRTIMEDSVRELKRHLPIWLAAHGQVLATGLGLGCVVRGLLSKPSVEHIDVVEIDADIIRVVGAEFEGNPRVTIRHGDALTIAFPPEKHWDFAWHDLCTDGDKGLQVLHGKLLIRFREQVGRQGAWMFPRSMARIYGQFMRPLIGAPKLRNDMPAADVGRVSK